MRLAPHYDALDVANKVRNIRDNVIMLSNQLVQKVIIK